jgi:hypothetical protein
MTKKRHSKHKRVDGGFCALPHEVIDSPSYRSISHTARSLLIDLARQYKGDNNGQLLLSINCLKPWGWRSADVITRKKRELLEAGLIYETVMGYRPNKASWYAVTWWDLDSIKGFDPRARQDYQKGAYRTALVRNSPLSPMGGTKKTT